jgi:paraquat-inducible protein B
MMDDIPIQSAIVQTKRKRRISLIWLIPVISLLIGGWLVWDTYAKRGPKITITFDQGEGLTAGQSLVKHRDVTLGTVTAVKLTRDMNHVAVTVQMTRDATPLITSNTKFWIVRPRFFAGSLSGPSCSRRRGSARWRWARRSSTATSRSGRSLAGISARSRRT